MANTESAGTIVRGCSDGCVLAEKQAEAKEKPSFMQREAPMNGASIWVLVINQPTRHTMARCPRRMSSPWISSDNHFVPKSNDERLRRNMSRCQEGNMRHAARAGPVSSRQDLLDRYVSSDTFSRILFADVRNHCKMSVSPGET